MAKVVIVYESRYGNTKRVAETIMKGIRDAGVVEAFLSELKEIDFNSILGYDAVLIGSPNHMGWPTRGIKSFIDRLGELRPEGKKFAVFDTYMGNDLEKAVEKMEKRISEKIPGTKQLVHGLSIRVLGMRGPLAEGELQKCVDFGNKIVVQLKSGC
ncbi:FprA family A-type flavoprotein [Candidatus Bathyarchaeota archaeon]|nr:FprA family A-type flavoprotein [Candidatus Bathyarchaeota archaeon]